MNKLLVVSGFGWSGSGLLIDVLTSTNNWEVFPVEFRLIKDKGGIIDLMNSSENSFRTFNYSIDLENFENLCNVLARTNRFRFGMNYDKFTNYQFSKATKKLIQRLKNNYYFSDAFVFQYNNNFISDFCWKILRKFEKRSRLKKRYLPLSENMLKSEFFDFFDELFIQKSNKQIILDQAIDAGDDKTINLLSEKFKMITVDRDPRDIFVSYFKSRDVIFNAKSFIDYYKLSRKDVNNNNLNVLRINFEDFINNNNIEIQKVIKFLNISDSTIITNLKNYDYSFSKKNIGIHKNFFDQNAIKQIEKGLQNYYCFT